MTRIDRSAALAALSLIAAPAAPAIAQSSRYIETASPSETAGERSSARDSWVAISGTIVGTDRGSFRLDYGSGILTVRTEAFAIPNGTSVFADNDRVVVLGRIDDEFLEQQTLEASCVFSESLGTTFYGDPAGAESFQTWSVSLPLDLGAVELTGTVSAIQDRKFTVSVGGSWVVVDTTRLPYNPLDESGYQRLEVGDRVKVFGELDQLIPNHLIDADHIVELGQLPNSEARR